jgi:antitoxin MazE
MYIRSFILKTQLAKWGNSLAVRIPKPVADAADLRSGDTLVLDVEATGAVTIRKSKRAPTLKDLVLRITPENRHAETDWGRPAEKELW